MNAQSPDLGWSVDVRELCDKPLRFNHQPDDEERRQIAEFLQIRGVEKMSFAGEVAKIKPGLFHCKAKLKGLAVQACVVTLQDVHCDIDETVDIRFADEKQFRKFSASTLDVDMTENSDDPPDLLAGNEVRLDALAIEHIALELDPYPRSDNANFSQSNEALEQIGDKAIKSPFADLDKRLKEKQE